MHKSLLRSAAALSLWASSAAVAAPPPAGSPPAAASAAAASPMDAKLAGKIVLKRRAAVLSASETAQQDATLATTLALQHKPLKADVTSERAAFNQHLSAAKLAYPLRVAPPKPPKRPPPLPKVDSLKKAKAEYEAVVASSARLTKASALLRANEEQLEQRAESAAEAATRAKTSLKEAQDAAAVLTTQARAPAAPPELKDAAKEAQAELKEARDAAAKASAAASKTRTTSGFTSKAAYASKLLTAQHDDEKAQALLATVKVTLHEASDSLTLQTPYVPHCDPNKVPWRDMTYPWVTYGTQYLPLTIHDGAPVCHEANPDDCSANGTPNVADDPQLADLDGDGKPEVVLTMVEFCCDVTGYETLVFAQDASCHLNYLGSAQSLNATPSISGQLLVVDQPYAKRGENIGLGDATGVEHVEWRIVKGQLKQTKLSRK